MLYYIMNKPAGCITAVRDEKYRTVMYYVPEELRGKLHPVGRLDADTTGLLILTDDGRLDTALLDPVHHLEKTYRIYAFGDPYAGGIERLESSVCIGKHHTLPARVENIQTFEVKDMEPLMPSKRRERYMKNPHGKAFSCDLIITEGKKHQVKLMMKAIGCTVCRLIRTKFGELTIDGIAEGELREMTDEERGYILDRVRAAE